MQPRSSHQVANRRGIAFGVDHGEAKAKDLADPGCSLAANRNTVLSVIATVLCVTVLV